ncbi:MAG: glycosyltransferase [Balneola sp.]
MKKIILLDQDLLHYRISIYKKFELEFRSLGYTLKVYCDKKLNPINEDIFEGVDYSFTSLKRILDSESPNVVIQFVWLKYKFLFPLMFWMKLKGISIILWSHGINLQKREQLLKNQLYYLRQKLADALILYTKNEVKFIKSKHEKIFIANNTLDFDSLPQISSTKEQLKLKYDYDGKKVILSVGRFNVNNRKIDHLIELAKKLESEYKIILIGPGVSEEQRKEIDSLNKIEALGPIFDQGIVCEYYKLSDLFVMPGAIGLAINQAFYFNTPIILEDCNHGPEIFYLINGKNGYLYKNGDVLDLYEKVKFVTSDGTLEEFSKNAKKTISDSGTLKHMLEGFKSAIKYVEKKDS